MKEILNVGSTKVGESCSVQVILLYELCASSVWKSLTIIIMVTSGMIRRWLVKLLLEICAFGNRLGSRCYEFAVNIKYYNEFGRDY